jgi:hypothetical protein
MSDGLPSALLNFSRAVDIVSEDTAEFIRERIDHYMSLIKAGNYLVLIDGAQLPEGPGLGTFQSSGRYWSSNSKNVTIPLRNENWKPRSLMPLAYETHKPIWVVDKGGESLKQSDVHTPDLIDMWSGCKDLPAFQDIAGIEPKTSIVLPLDHAYRIFGVLNIQFAEHREPTDLAKENFKSLADAIAVIINLYQVRQAQLSDQKMARETLTTLLDRGADSPFERPKLFFAYAENADKEVIDVIHRVFTEFDKYIEVEDWKRNVQPGDLHEHMRKSISFCRYAVCYLSEPAPGGTPSLYIDNSNVLIEAGIFYALSLDPSFGCHGWFPVRESDSLDTPFDISPINTVKVERRDQDGQRVLEEDDLEKKLRVHLKELLKVPD